MANLVDGLELLKADKAGRVRMPPEKRAAILAEFDRCGMSGAAFAGMIGVKYSTLASWVQRHRQNQAPVSRAKAKARPKPPIAFLEAHAPQRPVPLELELPGRVLLRIADASQVPLAVALLRGVGSC